MCMGSNVWGWTFLGCGLTTKPYIHAVTAAVNDGSSEREASCAVCRHIVMPRTTCDEVTLLDLPVDVLKAICLHLEVRGLVRVAGTCTRFRHGGLEMLELPTKSPVVAALQKHACPGEAVAPEMRPTACAGSWMAY